jgi:hypothetical protein
MLFAATLWIVVLLRSAVIGFGQNNGLAQVIALIVIDALYCIGKRTCRTHNCNESRCYYRSPPISAILQPRVQQSHVPCPNQQTGVRCAPFGIC